MTYENHAAAVESALLAIEPINAEMRRMNARVSHATAVAYAAGRYRWPEMDRVVAAKRDLFIETALRAGADPSRIGPANDVSYIQRRIAVRG
jgi:hypothetical protein